MQCSSVALMALLVSSVHKGPVHPWCFGETFFKLFSFLAPRHESNANILEEDHYRASQLMDNALATPGLFIMHKTNLSSLRVEIASEKSFGLMYYRCFCVILHLFRGSDILRTHPLCFLSLTTSVCCCAVQLWHEECAVFSIQCLVYSEVLSIQCNVQCAKFNLKS